MLAVAAMVQAGVVQHLNEQVTLQDCRRVCKVFGIDQTEVEQRVSHCLWFSFACAENDHVSHFEVEQRTRSAGGLAFLDHDSNARVSQGDHYAIMLVDVPCIICSGIGRHQQLMLRAVRNA